jgi:hypothetical protein
MSNNVYEFLQRSKDVVTSEIGNIGGKVASIEIPEIVKPIDQTEIQYARAIIR